MSRFTKYSILILLLLFILACNAVTQPIEDVQNLAGTAESFASAMPLETLQAVASQIPVETLQALPSALPTVEVLATSFADIGDMFNPQGTPVSEWNGVPVMPQATAGQEFAETGTYSYKVNATVAEAQEFYNSQLTASGWTSLFNSPAENNGTVQVFQKDESFLTITIMDVQGQVLVLLALA